MLQTQPVDPERLDLSFGMDPIGALAARGDLDAPWPERSRARTGDRHGSARAAFYRPFHDGRRPHLA